MSPATVRTSAGLSDKENSALGWRIVGYLEHKLRSPEYQERVNDISLYKLGITAKDLPAPDLASVSAHDQTVFLITKELLIPLGLEACLDQAGGTLIRLPNTPEQLANIQSKLYSDVDFLTFLRLRQGSIEVNPLNGDLLNPTPAAQLLAQSIYLETVHLDKHANAATALRVKADRLGLSSHVEALIRNMNADTQIGK